jgi:hypothetical protein
MAAPETLGFAPDLPGQVHLVVTKHIEADDVPSSTSYLLPARKGCLLESAKHLGCEDVDAVREGYSFLAGVYD